ncbi:hypothetical protein ACFL5O_00255 [Myxococcota bacterium]
MTAGRTQIEWCPVDGAALAALYERELCQRRAFVPGVSGVAELQLCTLVLVHPETQERFELEAEAVWIQPKQPGGGVGFVLTRMDAKTLGELAKFVAGTSDAGESYVPAENADPTGQDTALGGQEARTARSLYDRIRGLSPHERDAMARKGSLPERVALERTFGGAVWEALLQNPQLTSGEVAQIAKNPSLPTPLLSAIVGASAWLSRAEVQRGLLGNPRLGGALLDRVLRSMSPGELRRLAEQPGIRPPVRLAAKRQLG